MGGYVCIYTTIEVPDWLWLYIAEGWMAKKKKIGVLNVDLWRGWVGLWLIGKITEGQGPISKVEGKTINF